MLEGECDFAFNADTYSDGASVPSRSSSPNATAMMALEQEKDGKQIDVVIDNLDKNSVESFTAIKKGRALFIEDTKDYVNKSERKLNKDL